MLAHHPRLHLDKESGWGVGLQERGTGQACPSPPGSPSPTLRGGSGAAPGRPHHLAQVAEGPGGHKSQLLQLSPPQCCVVIEGFSVESEPRFGVRLFGPQPAPQAGLLGGVRGRCCSSGQHLCAGATGAAAAAAALSRFTPPAHHPDASNNIL